MQGYRLTWFAMWHAYRKGVPEGTPTMKYMTRARMVADAIQTIEAQPVRTWAELSGAK